MNDIGAVDQPERFADIVIGDENADPAAFEMMNEKLDIADRDGIDSGEGFIEEHEGRSPRQGAGDFAAAAFPAGQRDGGCFAEPLDVKLFEQGFKFGGASFLVGLNDFQNRANIILDAETAEIWRPPGGDSRSRAARAGTSANGLRHARRARSARDLARSGR